MLIACKASWLIPQTFRVYTDVARQAKGTAEEYMPTTVSSSTQLPKKGKQGFDGKCPIRSKYCSYMGGSRSLGGHSRVLRSSPSARVLPGTFSTPLPLPRLYWRCCSLRYCKSLHHERGKVGGSISSSTRWTYTRFGASVLCRLILEPRRLVRVNQQPRWSFCTATTDALSSRLTGAIEQDSRYL